jgi:uncharacterized circularly permuted ATP-grasp superfamily protein
VELAPAFLTGLAERMRASKLVFGDRIHCPFLRPFFLDPRDEARVRRVAEVIAAIGERVVAAALASPALLAQVALRPEEEALARIDPRYRTASTASRLDAFLLPDSLQFAEYNAESPAGSGYTETLAGVFESLPVMARFKERFDVQAYPLGDRLLRALLESYREWGGTNPRPQVAIVDWRDVPTWSEFEILQARFETLGIPTLVCDPRDLTFETGDLMASGRRIDLVYRRVLINDIVARPEECRALVQGYSAGAVCMANTLQCKIPHKKAFFAVLTDPANDSLFSAEERALVADHVPWTRLVRDVRTTGRHRQAVDLLAYIRANRDDLVIKPNDEYGGTGVVLGWEADERVWDSAIDRAVAGGPEAWVVQQRIAVRREMFPMVEDSRVAMRDMLVDFAPYLFRGRLAGFLTRLSGTGLANVTSGGGQVPAFLVSERAAS